LSLCEKNNKNPVTSFPRSKDVDNDIRRVHIEDRRISENDFFAHFVNYTKDKSHPLFIPKGSINSDENISQILASEPEIIFCYGSSIIKGALLELYAGRFFNCHLGLSPWYRGSGTNFWPLVNKEPEFVGATFMHIDAGIDTGEIIHQIRPKIYINDTPHQIGNRLISGVPAIYKTLAKQYKILTKSKQPPKKITNKICRRNDFTIESVVKLYKNFNEGMIENYLANKSKRDKNVPIVRNINLEETRLIF